VVNFATYSDNVTITLEGYLAEEGAAYLDISGSMTGHLRLPSQKIYSDPKPTSIEVTVFPDEDIEKRDYRVRLRILSEDGRTVTYTDYITVEVKDKPREGFGQEISDNLYDFLTDTLPFLKPVRQDLLVPLFLIFVAILVALISGIGILIYRKKFRRVVKDDPYVHQRKLYRDLYGVNPSDEQLRQMEQGTHPEEEDFFSEIPDIGSGKDVTTTTQPTSVHDGKVPKDNGMGDDRPPKSKESEVTEEVEDLEEVEEMEDEDYLDPDSL
ncbi:MAG: hypothetical protein JW939_05870, partial [Candidatus Thermoplasmatota archaeon]|nr:hypothetical protein [Candidatus Thermoplasmatota archaeon]